LAACAGNFAVIAGRLFAVYAVFLLSITQLSASDHSLHLSAKFLKEQVQAFEILGAQAAIEMVCHCRYKYIQLTWIHKHHQAIICRPNYI